MKKEIVLIVGLLLACMMVSCHNNDYTPKPQAYLRIDMPEHNYWLVDTLPTFKAGDTIMYGGDTMVILDGSPYMMFPFIFEANQCVELAEKDSPKGEVWLDIRYPQWDGVVFLTYKHLAGADDLRGQTDTSIRLMEKHYKFASGIDEQAFESDDHTVHAVRWNIKGRNVASTYQFYATDSVHHFLRGALYINRAPNNDSLAPVINYIQEDIDHLIETLRWR
jgi:gliding motility-associated lipoprotein GldD